MKAVMMKILRIFFFLFSCGELWEAVLEAEEQMNVVISENSSSDLVIKFIFGSYYHCGIISNEKCVEKAG